MPSPDGTPYRVYGRRQRRRLRPGRAALLEELLPRLTPPTDAAPGTLDPATLFDVPVRETWLEVGFGSGEHLLRQAEREPETGFLGCEPFVNGAAALLARLTEEMRARVRVLMGDARPLLDALVPASVGRAFLLFPDPWPKRRHAKRRFLQPATLDAFARVLVPGAELRAASDHPVCQRWMLRLLLDHPAFEWTARRPGDFAARPADWPETRYEARAVREGARPVFLTFRRTGGGAG